MLLFSFYLPFKKTRVARDFCNQIPIKTTAGCDGDLARMFLNGKFQSEFCQTKTQLAEAPRDKTPVMNYWIIQLLNH
ncbi:hypothetical protein P872_06190 [Rhodonellum psychrophilum GCM71 = DSM 17998]|uniref:Uncharacterized protein n=1 Tax=Rhodonellum psychrophilum GCM71 = DSM 17998 TaxID=1123057 RepID=U5BR42_9BACT|nr:hypothetical protein P872_06190 [Rhodonellum psychrophilum GCM71 = DSM 17998]